jgi:hypothetical protein
MRAGVLVVRALVRATLCGLELKDDAKRGIDRRVEPVSPQRTDVHSFTALAALQLSSTPSSEGESLPGNPFRRFFEAMDPVYSAFLHRILARSALFVRLYGETGLENAVRANETRFFLASFLVQIDRQIETFVEHIFKSQPEAASAMCNAIKVLPNWNGRFGSR